MTLRRLGLAAAAALLLPAVASAEAVDKSTAD